MSTTPPIQYSGPVISSEVPFETRRHLQLIYQKLGNHTQAFSLQQNQINKIKPGSTTTIFEGGGGGGITPGSGSGIPVNNQSGVTSYATQSGDDGVLIVFADASPIAVSLTTQTPPFSCFIANQGALGAGTVTLTPASGTINGGATLTIPPTYWALVAFDSVNWYAAVLPMVPVTFTAVAHEFLTAYNGATGVFTAAQPAIADVSGLSAALALLAPIAGPTFTGVVTQPDSTVLTAATTATSATAGAASALPATPSGYLEVSINSTVFKVPYYAV